MTDAEQQDVRLERWLLGFPFTEESLAGLREHPIDLDRDPEFREEHRMAIKEENEARREKGMDEIALPSVLPDATNDIAGSIEHAVTNLEAAATADTVVLAHGHLVVAEYELKSALVGLRGMIEGLEGMKESS